MFEKSGAENGLLPGLIAKQIFERARLSNEILGRIWNLADTRGRGALDITEFAVAMHLLASYKSGAMRGVPQTLPSGLYEAAAKRAPVRTSTGSYPAVSLAPPPGISPQFTGTSTGRPQSPIARQQMSTPLSAQSTGDGWAIGLADKASFDQIFSGIDKLNRGYITGDQAVDFFGNARLPQEVLAQIWDLADINSEGRLNRDEFAVAMYLIRQQRGTKEGRGNLPATLPPALVPPMMRKQQAPPSQPTAPAFENAPITKPRSAADDLFGLDAFSSTPSQIPQSSGDSSTGGPFQNPKTPLPPATSNKSPPSNFKPFVPSSSFGQSIAPQQTGPSTLSHPRSPQPSASNDLLGDADPEISQKLTSETSELANLSNQVSSLSKQMQDVQHTKASTQQELSQGSQQKKEFELRLSQLRTMYEREAKDVKSLQEQLSTHRTELKRMQQDIAMLEGGLQELQSQRQQLSTALEEDLQEKAALNEKIKATNAEINDLKPLLEKMKSETRQQRGLVAISKKQLTTLDAERDRLQNELEAAKVDLDAAKKAVEEQALHIPQTSSVASPAASTLSATNPFFRRGTGTSEGTFPPSATSRQQTADRDSAFDSMFGPSFVAPTTSTPPPVSFKNDSPPQSQQIGGAGTAITRSESPSQFSSNEPFAGGEPPPPPKFGQILSAALPFRAPLGRTDSLSSSVKVVPPASRLSPADTPRAATPSVSASSTLSQNGESPVPTAKEFHSGGNEKLSPSPHFEQVTPTIEVAETPTLSEQSSMRSSSQDIPGAFPQSETPRSEPAPVAPATGVAAGGLAVGETISVTGVERADNNHESGPKSQNLEQDFDQYFGGPAHSRSPSEKAADFDSAFAKFKQPTTNGTVSTSNNEFPPIRELDDDDTDDSSEAPVGFDDNFTPVSPRRPPKMNEAEQGSPEVVSAVPASLQTLQGRPPVNTVSSVNSSPPEIEAQKSPPTYDESVPHDNPGQFPPEFKGLLPRRGDPTSSVNEPPYPVNHISGESTSRSLSQPYAPEVAKSPPAAGASAAQSPAMPRQRKFTEDDFDAAFADLTPAPVVEDDDDDDFDPANANNHVTEFDPTFDSPDPSKSATTTIPAHMATTSPLSTTEEPISTKDSRGTSEFNGFSADTNDSQPLAPLGQSAPTSTFKDSDWDDMFASLHKPATSSAPDKEPIAEAVFSSTSVQPPNIGGTSTAANNTSTPSSSSPLAAGKIQDSTSERPVVGRALTAGTDHDDPLLKRLTAMGWSREESLKALEKYDYNIDKVRHVDSPFKQTLI